MSASRKLGPARVRVPASTSNLGAGFDCLGLALNRYLTAAYEPGRGALELRREGTLASLAVSPADDALVRAFLAHLARLRHKEPGGVIRVASEIPVGRGLGSSAAARVAGIGLAAAAARAGTFDRDAALWQVEAEEGHPDNGAPALFGGLVGVTRDGAGRARAFPLPLSGRIAFAFAAPGREVATPAARGTLPRNVALADAAAGLGRLAALLQGLAAGDPELLALGMADSLHVPHRLPLIPGAGPAIEAAGAAGAWGVTISGSGSGLIAACARGAAGEVAEAMAEAFRYAGEPDGVVAFAAKPDRRGAACEEVDG